MMVTPTATAAVSGVDAGSTMTERHEPVRAPSMPALLRAAGQVYAAAVGQALEDAGCGDVPRHE